MALFNLFKKTPPPPSGPYRDEGTNQIYQLLFSDNAELYRSSLSEPYPYPFDILLSPSSSIADLQKVADDGSTEARAKILAYNLQMARSHKPANKELLGVIVEVGMEGGLDTLAAYSDHTARYINYTGSMIIWDNHDDATAGQLIEDLFAKSREIVSKIGPWDNPRRPAPAQGMVRISFLVSDELYFGEGPIQVLFNDPMANPALMSATALMQFLTNTAMNSRS
ncbi:MAG: hypothetical protein JNJ90_17225 [Saprospiraceae bacterium]|jgi:hypothetical protein|nr:hypothetical protein [Saprospiraceae bacterium]